MLARDGVHFRRRDRDHGVAEQRRTPAGRHVEQRDHEGQGGSHAERVSFESRGQPVRCVHQRAMGEGVRAEPRLQGVEGIVVIHHAACVVRQPDVARRIRDAYRNVGRPADDLVPRFGRLNGDAARPGHGERRRMADGDVAVVVVAGDLHRAISKPKASPASAPVAPTRCSGLAANTAAGPRTKKRLRR